MRYIACIVSLVALAACSNSTAPTQRHIVTAKSPAFVINTAGKVVPNPDHILLDQASSWCNVSSVPVFDGLAVGDTVPAGTCLWYATVAP